MHSLGFSLSHSKCSSVVYQPKKIGVKEMSAGRNQTLAIIMPTVFFVMYNGYSSGLQMAKYLAERKSFKELCQNKLRDFVTPVDWYAAQMQNTRRWKIYIQTVPNVTHKRAKKPLARQLNRRIKCHRTESDQHIGHRQWYDKVICDYSAREKRERHKFLSAKILGIFFLLSFSKSVNMSTLISYSDERLISLMRCPERHRWL